MTSRSLQRESNYELLRMFAGMAIIVLHYNYHPDGGGALTLATGISYKVLFVLEAICICAVNIFVMLSGYFGNRSRSIRLGKLARLLVQTSVFRLAFCIAYGLIHSQWNIKTIVASLLPVNYYVILYVALMLVAPFINLLIDTLDQRSFSILTLVVFIVFSVYSTGVDLLKEISGNSLSGLSSVGIDGSMKGYTIVNFICVYIIGVWLKKDQRLKNCKTRTLLLLLLGTISLSIIWRLLFPDTSWIYNNPLVIAEAAIILSLFGKIHIHNKIINEIAPASFTCFLIQGNLLGLVLGHVDLNRFPSKVILLLIGSVLGIYLASYVTMKMWNIIMNPLFKASIDRLPQITIRGGEDETKKA